jgi:hypothetical protein
MYVARGAARIKLGQRWWRRRRAVFRAGVLGDAVASVSQHRAHYGALVPDWWLATGVAEDFYAYKPAFSALGFPQRYGKCNAWVVDVVVQRHSHKGADGTLEQSHVF